MTVPEPGGRYCVVRTRTLFGWVIRMATHSEFDHAIVLRGDGTCVEATPRDVRVAPLSEYAGFTMAANTAEAMTGAQRETVLTTAMSFVGAEYAWDEIAAIALSELGLHWQILLRLLRAQRALICSVLVAKCGAAAGLDWLGAAGDIALVTPADLARRAGMRPYRA